MAINLARMGTIASQDDGFSYDPADEARKIQLARDLRKKNAQDLQAGEIDLAKAALAQKEFERTTKEAEQGRGIRSGFLINREGAQDVPVGIRSPEFVDDSRPSNAPFGPLGAPTPRNKMESNAIIDLARVNPDMAEQFRTGNITERQGQEDRTRKMAGEDQKQIDTSAAFAYKQKKDESDLDFNKRQQAEVERDNRVKNNIAWVMANAAKSKADAAGAKGANGKILPSDKVLTIADQKSGIDLLNKLSKSAPENMNPLTSWFRTKNPYDTKAQTFNQYLATTKQIIGKNLEGGVLRLEDEKKYEKILPKPSDTKGVRRRKEAQLADMLVSRRNQELQSLGQAGYDVSGQEPSELNEDDAALIWAMQNSSDPRAKQLLIDLDKEQ